MYLKKIIFILVLLPFGFGSFAGQLENKLPISESGTSVPDLNLTICSDLEVDFENWPQTIRPIQRQSFLLALNISGSYEGNSAWSSIANNFDGQGLSAGLLNQNLGQGSIQPMLLNVKRSHINLFNKYFSKVQVNLLNSMLENWASQSLQAEYFLNKNKKFTYENIFGPESSLDYSVESETQGKNTNLFLTPRNQDSVDWALKNIYLDKGRTFDPKWKMAFKDLLSDDVYILEQLYAATILHKRAIKMMKSYSARELRSYLFFFDIAVQNGGIQKDVRRNYIQHIKKNSHLSELNRMKVLLNFRLRRVRKRFRKDVLRRKLTILEGEGFVHGVQRNFPKEYCVKNWSKQIFFFPSGDRMPESIDE